MKRKTLFAVISACLISFLIGASFVYLVYAPSPRAFWISEGVYPQASYTIEFDGTSYYAKNVYGELTYSGTNGSVVVQNAVNDLPAGFYGDPHVGIIQFMEGRFRIQNIILPQYGKIWIRGSGRDATVIWNAPDHDNPNRCTFIYNRTDSAWFIKISDMSFVNSASPASRSQIYLRRVDSLILENLMFRGSRHEPAIFLEQCYFGEIREVEFQYCYGAIQMDSTLGNNNHFTIDNVVVQDCLGAPYAIYVEGSSDIIFNEVTLQRSNSTVGIGISATSAYYLATSTINNLLITDAPYPNYAVQLDSFDATHNIRSTCIINPQVIANTACFNIKNYTVATSIIGGYSHAGQPLTVLVEALAYNTTITNMENDATALISGKPFFTFNNNTYVVIP